MTKIESRPSRRAPWEYVFFVDIDGHERDADVAAALADVRAKCESVKVLGSYPKAESIAPAPATP
jgi:chorismate mutase/prephenate dehydratase